MSPLMAETVVVVGVLLIIGQIVGIYGVWKGRS